MKLTKNFSLPEFASRDGGAFTEEAKSNIGELAINLQILRDHFGKAIQVTSGYRTPAHNERIGGAENSFHLWGMACDIKITGIKPYIVAKQIELLIHYGKMKEGGIGIYDSWVHYDIRGHYARWDKRKNK